MAFNSLHFFLFFVVVYGAYLLCANRHSWQNFILLAASYIFYSFWNWRFLSLIFATTIANYYFGLWIEEASSDKRRKSVLILSIFFNLGLLGFFKYFNFFSDGLYEFLSSFGWHLDKVTLNIILPLGISFYTFQVLSYPIDIYRRMMKPTKRLSDFALFVSFFPLLISGPIERARNLLPQVTNTRHITLDRFYKGSWLIFWGIYKKIFIADNMARLAAGVFGSPLSFSGGEVLVATYAFAFQVYADFSGYSDMARGLSILMGFDIMLNFRTPFFSSNMFDFWQRWHISLTTWIKEYLFYPLALAKFFGRQLAAPLVIIVTWAIMGFWHGPDWKFVLWGVYHGVILVIYSKIRPYLNVMKLKSGKISNIRLTLKTLLVFHIFCIGIIFFAAPSSQDVFLAIGNIFSNFRISPTLFMTILAIFLMYTGPLIAIEYFQHKIDDEFVIFRWSAVARGVVYFVLLYSIIMWGDFSVQKYYYFQF